MNILIIEICLTITKKTNLMKTNLTNFFLA